MNKLYSIALTAGLLGLLACNNSDGPTDTPTSGNINISVDETFRPIIESQVNTFEGIYTRADIDDTYKPEGQVVEDLLTDSTRVAILSRELTPEERAVFDKQKRIPRSTKIAIDAVALIVNKENSDSLLTVEELKRIFSGQAKTWKDLDESSELGDITVVFDNNNSSTARYVRDSLTTNQKLPENSFAAESHEALIDYVTENKNAIGVLGVNWISDRDDTTAVGFMNKVRVVGVSEYADPISEDEYYQPYQAYIAQQVYPLRRNLYIISTEGRSGLGTGFAAYVASDKGQRIILKSGLVPATMPVRVIGLGNQ
ncbi:phosphate ABC transporter substrate-binding protein (PhoT family) [Pontibacter ummariensis]|uniref:Phosphate ABC transporter substrate-binding protein, PhoT family n=2 Tax=Pontibacter ummariensis TaxID=1610492 RepID=A0A239JK75_9BACT|nr:phosphate ABC transporter substrate-binding protein (PhoT family) [Pontibacter ummariensis]SNT05144.1 phosphate ABC transporter substrate-binding protein, PhoT family [Pontibacter ummariensis]